MGVLLDCQVSERRATGCCFIGVARAERKLGRKAFVSYSPKLEKAAWRYQRSAHTEYKYINIKYI